MIAEIRDALASAVETTGIPVSAYVTDQVNPPQAVIVRKGVEYHMVFNSSPVAVYTFSVLVYVARTSAQDAQELLDTLADPYDTRSVLVALEDEDLYPDGLVHYVKVDRVSDVQSATVGQTAYLLQEFDVEVVA